MTSRFTAHETKELAIGAGDHVQGRADAPVTLLEYGDYQCPHCGQAHLIVKALQRQLGDSVRFAFRHFPLNEIHRYAELAAEAAEAAGAQEKFWQMHDTLMTNQQALTPEDLHLYADDIDLDAEQFKEDLERHTYAGRLEKDLETGRNAGVHGTPTFFINGVPHQGSFDLDTLLQAIQAQLAKQAA